MRKKKWVPEFLAQEEEYLLKDMKNQKCDLPLYVEIGMGDFITQSAKMNPSIFYIGLEREETCVARAIKKARDLDLKNLKIIFADAMNIEELFDEESIDLIYLHFSDPWPKKRTHKRRLTYPSFLSSYEKVLKRTGNSSSKPTMRISLKIPWAILRPRILRFWNATAITIKRANR